MSEPISPHTVAVVDDEPLITALLGTVLQSLDRTVKGFESAAEALMHPHLAYFQTIFLDLTLPDMQGLELVDAVARAAPQAHLVIFSGHDRSVLNKAKWHARLCGVARCSVLSKPFTRDEVLQVLQAPSAIKPA